MSVFAGSPKIGKSWMVLEWCVKISKGEDIWGLHTNSGTVLYLSLEDTEGRLQNRLLSVSDDVNSKLKFSTSCSTLDDIRKELPQEERFVHENFVPAIISKEKWEQAQFLLEAKTRKNVRASTSNP